MIQIKVNIGEITEVTATRTDGLWHVVGHDDGNPIDLKGCTDEQFGAMMHLCVAGNPLDAELDTLLYNQLTVEQRNSGLVP